MHVYSKKEGKYYEVNESDLQKLSDSLTTEELHRALLDQTSEYAKLRKSRKRKKPDLKETVQRLAVALYDRGADTALVSAQIAKTLATGKKTSGRAKKAA